MPKISSDHQDNNNEYENEPSRGRQFKSARRQSQRGRAQRASGRTARGRDRHISVRSELRDRPDMRKIARAVIQMAMAQAEAEAAAEAAVESGRRTGDAQRPERNPNAAGTPDD